MVDYVAVEDQVLVVSLNESAVYGDERVSYAKWETPSGETEYYADLNPGQTDLGIGNTGWFSEGVHTLTLIRDESPVLRLRIALEVQSIGLAGEVTTIRIIEQEK